MRDFELSDVDNRTLKMLEIAVPSIHKMSIHNGAFRCSIIHLAECSNNEVHVKIGKAMQMQSRIDTYDTGFADKIDILYQVQTESMSSVEACIKALCKEKQYRKRKEVYTIDIDVMKKVIDHCAKGASEVRRVPGRKVQKGGYFAVFCKDIFN